MVSIFSSHKQPFLPASEMSFQSFFLKYRCMSYFLCLFSLFFYVKFSFINMCLQNLFQSEHGGFYSFLELHSTHFMDGYAIVYFVYLQAMDCFSVFANVIKAAKDKWMVLPNPFACVQRQLDACQMSLNMCNTDRYCQILWSKEGCSQFTLPSAM